jgi:uncharacterized protein with PQ loop repeat
MTNTINILLMSASIILAAYSYIFFFHAITSYNTTHINLITKIIFTLACIMFAVYGIGVQKSYDDHYATTIANGLAAVFSFITVLIKLVNIIEAKLHNMTEKEFYLKVILPKHKKNVENI